MQKKRTKYDAPAPIIKPCTVDTSAIWGRRRKKTVSEELTELIINKRRKNYEHT